MEWKITLQLLFFNIVHPGQKCKRWRLMDESAKCLISMDEPFFLWEVNGVILCKIEYSKLDDKNYN